MITCQPPWHVIYLLTFSEEYDSSPLSFIGGPFQYPSERFFFLLTSSYLLLSFHRLIYLLCPFTSLWLLLNSYSSFFLRDISFWISAVPFLSRSLFCFPAVPFLSWCLLLFSCCPLIFLLSLDLPVKLFVIPSRFQLTSIAFLRNLP